MPPRTRIDDVRHDEDDPVVRRIEESAAKIERLTGDLQKGGLERALAKTLERNQKALERQLGSLLRETLSSALGGVLGGALGGGGRGAAGGIASVITGLLPGFARGGILAGRTTVATAGEAGPEVILPLRKGRDGRLGIAAAPAHTSGRGDASAPRRVEVVIRSDNAASPLPQDDGFREAVASAVADALDGAIDARIALHTRNGGMLRGNTNGGGNWQI